MVINMNDPRILAEVRPPTITAVGTALRARYGTGADSIGTQGNNQHNSGFHRSENWIRNSPDSRDHDQDYSLSGTLNISADRNAVCALDFTPGSWGSAENRRRMVELTTRVRNAALAHDPRLADVFEFAGTVNGTSVITFRCSDGAARSPFDSSHLDHCHASFYRARALNNHDGFTAVLLGTGETPMAFKDDADAQYLMYHAEAVAQMLDKYNGPRAGQDVPLTKFLRGLEASLLASANREAALAAAISVLTATVNSLATGGTSLDTAAVIAAVHAAADQALTTGQVAQVDAAAFAAAQRAEDS